jgi:hypothetical protein
MSFQITIDCADPDRMARFWAEALRYDLHGPPDGFATWAVYWISVGVPEDEVGDGYDSIVDPDGAGPRIWFQQVPEPKSVKNRLHFDVLVGGGRSVPMEERRRRVDAEAARLTALGAAERFTMDSPEVDHYFKAMSDPEGNEFDIV